MNKKLLIGLLAGTAVVAGAAFAFAEAPGGPMGWRHMSKEDMAAHDAEMCKDMYAHQVGEMAAIETKLSLTPAQLGPFAQWKNVKLGEAKEHSQMCASMMPPDMKAPPSPMEHMAREEEMLKARLADLQTERPLVAALYNTLNDDQKKTFVMAEHHMHGHGMHGMHGMMGHGMVHGHGDRDGDDDHDGAADHDGPPPPQGQ